jgi:hypothetical protein
MVVTAPADGWDQQALRPEQLADNDLGPLMRNIVCRNLEWRDISNRGLIYKNYWAQMISLASMDGVFVRHWESADVRKKTALVIVLKAKLNRS